MYILPETELIKTSQISKDKNSGTFVIEPLLPGYGMTLGNALRRVLLSSLTGAAITSVRIEGTTHEFSTLKGVKEDMVELIINLKNLKVALHTDEAATVKLSKKGPCAVTAADFNKNPQIEFSEPEQIIANLDKQGVLELEVTVEKGRGYVPAGSQKDEKPVLGNIAIDSIFTPIKRVNYTVENTRVGGKTDFDKLSIDITTDGTIQAKDALTTSIQIILDHFNLVLNLFNQKAVKLPKKNVEKATDTTDLVSEDEIKTELPEDTKKIKSVKKTKKTTK